MWRVCPLREAIFGKMAARIPDGKKHVEKTGKVWLDRLDKSRTLRENLMDRAIVEYPVLHVATPQDTDQLQLSKAAIEQVTSMLCYVYN